VASERDAALAALDEFFHDAMKAAANELDTLLAGKDASEAVELARVRTAIRTARRVRTEMLALIDQEWPP
jgi:hypothetical protein